MPFESEPLARGARGTAVQELQLRLAGFRGTTWDGIFGAGTELQVVAFQRDFMKIPEPNGMVEVETINALNAFAGKYPLDFGAIQCRCGECGSFGQNRFAGQYRPGKPEIEAYHQREYPGMHKAILHSYRTLCFYAGERRFPAPFLTCGYRCWVHNEQKGRTSTNHMGKALDADFPRADDEDKRDDCNRCDAVRGMMVETGNFQVGWNAKNCKSLEPSNIAPTWIHMDVRCYEPKYLESEFFVTSADALDAQRAT